MMFLKTDRLRIVMCVIAATGAMLLTAGFAAQRRPAPKPEATELAALQKEMVARLAGDSEIRPGVKLAGRATLESRQEVRTYLAGIFERLGMVPRRQGYGTEGENVFTILPCGNPFAPTIVLGAHYDSARNSPGANDNATGVAVVAAVAREMSRVKKRNRDFIFAFFDEEERGLRGSRAFAQMLLDEKRLVDVVHTIDQMGWDQDGDRAIELELPYEGVVDLYKKAAEALKLNIPILTTTESGSDHSAFRKLGFRAVGITEEYRNKDTTPQIHRPGDMLATVNFEYMASTTRLLAEVMKTLARR
jgi:hypothetical protein